MKNSNFYRSIAMMQAISVAIASGTSKMQLMQSPEFQYKSRGHGKGLPSKNYFNRSPSKYTPHQGKQEMLRRAK
jgi:hypothetical protein